MIAKRKRDLLSRRPVRWCMTLTLLVACTAAVEARAAAPSNSAQAKASNSAQAKVQFDQGRAAVRSGDLRRARSHFLASQELLPKTATLLNLGDCEVQLGLYASALQHFQQGILLAPPGDDRLPLLKQHAHAVTPRVPGLRIELEKDTPPGARVLLDAQEVPSASLQTEQPLDPGIYTLTVTAPGYKDRSYEVALQEQEHLVLRVQVGDVVVKKRPANVPAPTTSTTGTSKPDGLRIASIVLVGAGIAGLGAGSVLGGLAVSKKDQLTRVCPDPYNCREEHLLLAREGSQLGAGSTASLVAGAVVLAAGVTLIAVRLGPTTSKVGVVAGPSQAGVTMQGTF